MKLSERFSDAIRVLPRYCRRILIVPLCWLSLFAAIYLPFLFGYEPISVGASESEEYPARCFTYCFTGEQAIEVGRPVVLFREKSAEIKILAETVEKGTFRAASGELLRTEYIIGTPTAFCMRGMGPVFGVLFSLPSFLWALVLAVLCATPAYGLPRYFRKKEEDAAQPVSVSLSPEGIREIRFRRLPGDLYRAEEVDRVMNALAEALETHELREPGTEAEREKRINAVFAKMTDTIAQAVLEADRELGSQGKDE